jgi:hypothetical protein
MNDTEDHSHIRTLEGRGSSHPMMLVVIENRQRFWVAVGHPTMGHIC